MGQSRITDDEGGSKDVRTNIPDHTQIEWYDDEIDKITRIVNAKENTGLTYKQLLQLAAVTVEETDEPQLQTLIGKIQMQS